MFHSPSYYKLRQLRHVGRVSPRPSSSLHRGQQRKRMRFLRWLFGLYNRRELKAREGACNPRAVAGRTPSEIPTSSSHGTVNDVPTMLNRFGIHSVDFLLSWRIVPCLRLVDV